MKNLHKKCNSNKIKHILVEDELKKLETSESIYFRGKTHFENDDTQNYLVFQTTYRYFETVSNTSDHVLSWKPEGLSEESIKSSFTSTNIHNPLLDYVSTKTSAEFKGSCLKQDNFQFDSEEVKSCL